MINRGRCVTLVLLDRLSTKHDHRWIRTLWTYSRVCGIGAADILKFQLWTDINNFELTDDILSLLNSTTYVLFFS